MTRRRSLLALARGLLSLTLLLALLIGPPLFLAVAVGWPLPTDIPTWEEFRQTIDFGIPHETLLKSAALIVWAAWLLLALSIITEVASAAGARVARRLALVPQLHALIARLVTSATFVITTFGPVRAGASAAPEAAPQVELVVAEDTTRTASAIADLPDNGQQSPAQTGRPAGRLTPPPLPEIEVQRHDSYWAIAERTLGNGTRWRQIHDLNIGRTMPDGATITEASQDLRTGWILLLPQDAVIERSEPTPDELSGSEPDSTVETAHPAGAPVEITVQPGDNLWCLAEDHLTTVFGRAVPAAEVAPYWLRFIETNRSRLVNPDDPDLVYPGQTFILPAIERPHVSGEGDVVGAPGPPDEASRTVPTDSTSTTVPEDAADENAESPASDADGGLAPHGAPPSTSDGAGRSDDSSERPATTQPSMPEPPNQNGSPSAEQGDSATDDNGQPSTAVDVKVPVGVSAALAALTVAALTRRRQARRRLIGSSRSSRRRPPEDIETERGLAALSGDVLASAWRATSYLGDVLRAGTKLPTITGLVAHTSGETTVCFGDPVLPVEPFVEHPDDPRRWLLPTADLQTTRPSRSEPGSHEDDATERPAPVLETMVVLGHTDDGDWVFADLESLGAVSVVGDPTNAKRLARSLIAELALQPLDHYVNVTVAGLDFPEITHQEVVWVDHLDEHLTRTLERSANDVAAYLHTEGVDSTAAARATGLPRDGLVATVLATAPGADPVLLTRLAQAASRGSHSVGLVALDSIEAATTQLVVLDDGTMQVPHLGLTVHAAGLDPDDMQRIDELLRNEPDRPDRNTLASDAAPSDAGGATHLVLDATVPTNGDETPDYEPPAWDYCVRLFADLRVETADGEEVSFVQGEHPKAKSRSGHRGPDLLAYLGLQPDRSATVDNLREHMWWHQPVDIRTLDNLLSATRRLLGGGEQHLSYRSGPADRRRVRLAPSVVTDLELLEHALGYARQVAGLAPTKALAPLAAQLDRIESPAFQPGCPGQGLAEWASASSIYDGIAQAVVEAAQLAADLHCRTGSPSGAVSAVNKGLRACPHNEALVRAGMQRDAQAGHRDAAHHRYTALVTCLQRDNLTPDPDTTALHNQLMDSLSQVATGES